jgi:phosphoribosylaminoimidazolecarboxamide formyltransferase/IMP cyclohydrolase
MTNVDIKRALISVSDKTGLEALAKALAAKGVEIISSGGTGKFLKDHGLDYTPIEKVTGNPECFGGRMKTLSFQVSSAILFRRDNADDVKQAAELKIAPIDLVVCNLYPFEETAKKSDDWAEIVENIDIGGPTLIRAAAKNHKHVAVVTDPAQYDLILSGKTDTATCERLALAAFQHTARYDGMIAAKFEEKFAVEPRTLVVAPAGAVTLRYGENPHQKAWVYKDPFNPGIASAEPLQGKELSYNNLLDADAAWRSCGDIVSPSFPFAVSIIKHLSPCGLALAKTQVEALEQAWAGDPVSSFGGIVAFNTEVEEATAKWLSDKFVEVIVAPAYAKPALAVFAAKKNLRLLAVPNYTGTYKPPMLRSISGGWVVQQEDTGADTEFKTATKAPFPADKMPLAQFGIMAGKHLKSNAISIVAETPKGFCMIGAGMGNPNRVVSMHQAVEKARENGHTDLSSAVLVSDAFFPFPDNIDIAQAAGIRNIVQPGGSIKDKDVIAACDAAGIAMVMTGRRHFRH